MNDLQQLRYMAEDLSPTERMPLLFLGHGSPMNAIEENIFVEGFRNVAPTLPRPKSIICISAHWYTRGTHVTAMPHPETIHDFGGFPKALYQVQYPASGNPALAVETQTLLEPATVGLDQQWGLDHGAWSVLANMYPEADIPVVQLSIDENLPRKNMFDVGRELRMLREEGILILGSGNIVHNLRAVRWGGEPYDWAVEFDAFIRRALLERNIQTVIDFEEHPLAQYVLPTVEHFLPLLYVLGATAETEDPKFFTEDIFAASVGMRSVVFGG